MSPEQQYVVVVAATIVLGVVWIVLRVRRFPRRDQANPSPDDLDDHLDGGRERGE